MKASKIPCLSAVDESPAHANGQRDFEAPSRHMDKARDDLDLVEALVHRFENYPHCFHLEWPLGESPSDDVVYWIVDRAVYCSWNTRLDGSQPSAVNNVRLTDCRCDLSGGNEPRDPWHLAYQEACLKLVKAYISLFEKLSQNGAEKVGTILELRRIFLDLTWSSLLEHCCLDMELFSLCQSFFGLAKGCLTMSIRSNDWERGKENMLKWFEVSYFF